MRKVILSGWISLDGYRMGVINLNHQDGRESY